MEKLRKRLKTSVCIGNKTHKEDCNISNFSEFQTGDSGIVSDQSSIQDHPRMSMMSERFAKPDCDEPSQLMMFGYSRALLSSSLLLNNQHRVPFSHNLSAINENAMISSYPNHIHEENFPTNMIDYGPIHPYMKVAHFHKEQYTNTYHPVASTSEEDNQSTTSELFIPVKRSSKCFKDELSATSKSSKQDSNVVITSEELSWERISSKVLFKIFKFLSIGDILNCSKTCRNWYFIAWQPTVWTSIDFVRWVTENKSTDINYKIKKLLILLGGNRNPYCPLVHSIKLDKCLEVNDESIIFISNCCPNLKQLSIRKCTLVSNISIFHILSKCREMKKLNVEGCKMVSAINTLPETDASFSEFVLADLNLSHCQLIDDASLILLASKFKNMEKLLLRNCHRVTDIGINYLVRYCSRIQELSLNHLQRITETGICQISEKLNENLRYLSLANCIFVTDLSITSLADYCSNLQYLNLHKCKLVTDSGIMSLAISLQNKLVSLNLSCCVLLTNKSISVLSRYCKMLQQLDLSHCLLVSDEAVDEICNHVVNLKMLNIDNTSTTLRSYDIIVEKYPHCSIHHSFITDC